MLLRFCIQRADGTTGGLVALEKSRVQFTVRHCSEHVHGIVGLYFCHRALGYAYKLVDMHPLSKPGR